MRELVVGDAACRQHGDFLYSEDGTEVAVSPATLVEWFDMNKELMENGGVPPAAVSVEDIASGSPEQILMGQGKRAMKISWSN